MELASQEPSSSVVTDLTCSPANIESNLVTPDKGCTCKWSTVAPERNLSDQDLMDQPPCSSGKGAQRFVASIWQTCRQKVLEYMPFAFLLTLLSRQVQRLSQPVTHIGIEGQYVKQSSVGRALLVCKTPAEGRRTVS